MPSGGGCCTSPAPGPSTTSWCRSIATPTAPSTRPPRAGTPAPTPGPPTPPPAPRLLAADDRQLRASTAPDRLELAWADHDEWDAERRRAFTAARFRPERERNLPRGRGRHRSGPRQGRGRPRSAPVAARPVRHRRRSSRPRRARSTPTSAPVRTSTPKPPPSARPRASSAWTTPWPPSPVPRCRHRSCGERSRRRTIASCSSLPPSVAAPSRGTSTCSSRPTTAASSSTTRPTSGPTIGERAERIARYRRQLAVYGVVLEHCSVDPVAVRMLVRCRPDGPAEEIQIDGWTEALTESSPSSTAGEY